MVPKTPTFQAKKTHRVRDALQLKYYSIHTEQACVTWIKRCFLFRNKRHPKDMGVVEIEVFLTHLPVQKIVTTSTQTQALGALLFLYRTILKKNLEGSIDAMCSKKPARLPTS